MAKRNRRPYKKMDKREEFRREDRVDRGDKGNGQGCYRSKGENDISWYSKYPNLLLAAGSFPFPYRPGMSVDLGAVTPMTGAPSTSAKTAAMTIPGVMTLGWVPSIGTSNQATDPASVLGKQMYAKVREKYSGSIDADAPDFVMYVLALDSIFSYIAYLKRMYRVLNQWSPNNYIMPDYLLAAMGLQPSEVQTLRADKTNLWQIINELVLQTRKFTCPAIMDIFNRHYWMSDNVYTDEATMNSQFYMFNLQGVYMYADLPVGDGSGNTAAGLQLTSTPWVPNHGTAITTTVLYQFGQELIDALVAWDDAYMINGYLMRAYEGTPNFVVEELPSLEEFTPIYVEEVLMQIENSRVVTGGSNLTSYAGNDKCVIECNITQNPLTNAVICNPTITITPSGSSTDISDNIGGIMSGLYDMPPMLSIRSDSPTVADNTIASRLQAVTTYTERSLSKCVGTIQCGTEIPLFWTLNKGDIPTSMGNPIESVYAPKNDASALFYLLQMLSIEQFDWHPFVWMFGPFWFTSNVQTPVAVLGDTHNLTTITNKDLANLHRICLYSEFNSFEA